MMVYNCDRLLTFLSFQVFMLLLSTCSIYTLTHVFFSIINACFMVLIPFPWVSMCLIICSVLQAMKYSVNRPGHSVFLGFVVFLDFLNFGCWIMESEVASEDRKTDDSVNWTIGSVFSFSWTRPNSVTVCRVHGAFYSAGLWHSVAVFRVSASATIL